MLDYIYICKKEEDCAFRGIITRKHTREEVYIFSGDDFWKKNLSYIMSNATAKAVEIAQKTGRFSDVEDFRQMILIFMSKRTGRYNSQKSTPETYIEVCMESAKKNILRDFYRKRRKEVETCPLENADATAEDGYRLDILEYIESLSEPAREICKLYFVDALSIKTISARLGLRRREVSELLRSSMRPLAESLGIGLPPLKPTPPGGGLGSPRPPPPGVTPGEVVRNYDTLSFRRNTRWKI